MVDNREEIKTGLEQSENAVVEERYSVWDDKYYNALSFFKSAKTYSDYENAYYAFSRLGNHRDSQALAAECQSKMSDFRASHKKVKKFNLILSIISVSIVFMSAVATWYIYGFAELPYYSEVTAFVASAVLVVLMAIIFSGIPLTATALATVLNSLNKPSAGLCLKIVAIVLSALSWAFTSLLSLVGVTNLFEAIDSSDMELLILMSYCSVLNFICFIHSILIKRARRK